MSGMQAAWLPSGRLHLNEGPIDLIVEAFGEREAVRSGYARAVALFDGLLAGLVAELPGLRSPEATRFAGAVAKVMAAAVAPYRPGFITPMAAVAGAVADAVLAALAGPGIRRAYVNNGGDIALFLTPSESLTAALATGLGAPDRATVRHDDPVRGIATSGWRGRSQSLGIADAVTVLARTAAEADAAATMIANAVDLPGHPGIERRPAREIKADSDLGERPVTVNVAPLSRGDVDTALDRGATIAADLAARGLIAAAALYLQGELRTVGQPAFHLHAQPETCFG